jgi:DNA-binding GntR family transcriptional regulator
LYKIGSIAKSLGVSPTPVREALLDLGKDDLVEIVRNKGFVVKTVTDADLDEIFDLRVMLEVPAVRRLAGLALPDEIRDLRPIVAQIEMAAASADLPGFLGRDRDFHLRLLSLAGNRRLVEIVSRLRDQSRLHGLQELVGSQSLVESAREHARLLDAVEAHDSDHAARIMLQHLRHTRGLWAGREEEPVDISTG